MLKHTLQPHNNFKFRSESSPQASYEQVNLSFTKEQLSKAAVYAENNPKNLKIILSKDRSKLNPQQQRTFDLFAAINTSSSNENYNQTNATTKESIDPRTSDLNKVTDRMGREYEGLSTDEKNIELVNLATEFEKKKVLGTATKTEIMRLEVAHRLLGINSINEYQNRFKGKDNIENEFQASVPNTLDIPAKTKERLQRRNAKILGRNTVSKGELPQNTSGKGFVANLEVLSIGSDATSELVGSVRSENAKIDEHFYTQDRKYSQLKQIFDKVAQEYRASPFNTPEELTNRYNKAYNEYSIRRQAIPIAINVLNQLARNRDKIPTINEVNELVETQPFSSSHKDVKEIVIDRMYNNPYSKQDYINDNKKLYSQLKVENTLDKASEK